MSEARVWAQAKINLALRVLARERSGYHSIETVFHRLDVGDDVVVRVGGTARTLDCRGAEVGPVEENLAWRAAIAYANAAGWPRGFAIEVDKHIPVRAGLGGGSADAGAVLRALEALAPTPLGPRLLEVASELGADVPFLSMNTPMALAWGRGTRMLALAALPARPLALVVPEYGVATHDAYGWFAAEHGDHVPHAELLSLDDLRDWAGIARIAANDLQSPVTSRHPELATHIDVLRRHGASVAMMSGSGSSVFGVFGEKPASTVLAAETGCRVVLTRTAERVVQVEQTQ